MPATQSPAVFDPGGETLPPAELAALQEPRPRALIARLLAVPGGLLGQRLRDAGVTGGGGLTLADLPGLPMTGKSRGGAPPPPGRPPAPRPAVVAVHGSSGPGGRPTLVAYTRDDLRLWARM